uniref:CCT-theta n=1 Tax=Panagrellus redivivus TaxID=6233 RepID=A0A7E4VMK2_PANRE
MALSVPQGFHSRFMKDGAQAFKGVDEAVLRNIEACNELANQLKTAHGPAGMMKLIVNDIGKEFITADAATILKNLDIRHPAAKLLVMAADAVDSTTGDGVNTTILLTCALLDGAVELINMGLKPVEVVEGYLATYAKVEKDFPNFSIANADDLTNKESVKNYLRAAVLSKNLSHGNLIAGLIAEACIQVNRLPYFNVDNIRIVKVPGGSIRDSLVINGMVFSRVAETDKRSVTNAKVALFACAFDITQTETKGTVLMSNANELMEFSSNEEKEVERQVKDLSDNGINIVVAAGKFGDLYLHYLNKYGIMGVRLVSKFDLRRLCRMLGAPAQANICTPSLDHVGICDKVAQSELSGQPIITFSREGASGSIASIVLRGPTTSLLMDIERAVDDGINTFKALTRDNRLVGGAGAIELQIARYVTYLSTKNTTSQRFVQKLFSKAFEEIPKYIAANAGHDALAALSLIFTEQKASNKSVGINIFDANKPLDVMEENLFDSYLIKKRAIEVAVDAAVQILRVDQIIMAKPAGGPNPNAARQVDPEGNDDGMA